MQKTDQDQIVRLWRKDVTLWAASGASAESLTDRLGWLDAVEWMESHNREIMDWARRIVEEHGFDRVILLGMGGSSLSADVFASIFGAQPGFPELVVLDSTSPEQIRAVDHSLENTLFIVSSKSGTTVETACLYSWFFGRVGAVSDAPGSHFVAITDPDSWLQQQAEENNFLGVFLNPADIGGRYSALSFFGLVPAALLGIDLEPITARLKEFKQSALEGGGAEDIRQLARAMGGNGIPGCGKLFLDLAPSLRALGPWVEQLVAESSGKAGKGILPVWDPQPLSLEVRDGITVAVGFREDAASGPGDVSWNVADEYQIGVEFLRWEMATVLACSMLGVNPFDQPDVDSAKIRSREFVEGDIAPGLVNSSEEELFVMQEAEGNSGTNGGPEAVLERFRSEVDGCTYLGILAYQPMFEEVGEALHRLRLAIGDTFRLTTTLGYGPRYLHSTGQLHKGGPPTGCFIQLVEEADDSKRIPGQDYGFARLHRAQADGDLSVLSERSRPVLRVLIRGDRCLALENLTKNVGGMSTF